mmetsp:Transcript_40623/g.85020  ORF Transcript_40623/g.85020 Transcript_40623/m.85020 type:complete len:234 (+) Transcript_40623:2214-2915(+)
MSPERSLSESDKISMWGIDFEMLGPCSVPVSKLFSIRISLRECKKVLLPTVDSFSSSSSSSSSSSLRKNRPEIALSANNSLVKYGLSNRRGNVPVKKHFVKSNILSCFKFATSCGIDPCSMLFPSVSSSRSVNNPSSVGMVPDNPICVRLTPVTTTTTAPLLLLSSATLSWPSPLTFIPRHVMPDHSHRGMVEWADQPRREVDHDDFFFFPSDSWTRVRRARRSSSRLMVVML